MRNFTQIRKRFIFPLTTILFWLSAAGVLAFDGEQWNWDVEGMNGSLSVSATLTESSCYLTSESVEQVIDMKPVPLYQLDTTGNRSEPVNVHLILDGCLLGGIVRASEHGDNLTWLPNQPVVFMNIIGDEDPFDPHLFRINGEAKGVGLYIEDANHRQVVPGERSWPQVLAPGRNDLIFQAQLSRTSGRLFSGDYSAVINVGLEYE